MHCWSGRYRCLDCGVLAYKKLVLGCNEGPEFPGGPPLILKGRPEQMEVYKCQVRGCSGGAVTRRKGSKQFCAEHRHKENR